jgi:hypothetical protein
MFPAIVTVCASSTGEVTTGAALPANAAVVKPATASAQAAVLVRVAARLVSTCFQRTLRNITGSLGQFRNCMRSLLHRTQITRM